MAEPILIRKGLDDVNEDDDENNLSSQCHLYLLN